MAKKQKKQRPSKTAELPRHNAGDNSPSETKDLPWFRKTKLQALVLFVLAAAIYANTLGHDFALDDAIVITENSIVKKGVSGWGELFSHDTFYGFFNDDSKASLVAGGRYRPLTPAMFALERQISSGPFLHHLLNVLWYGLLVVVVFLFVRDLAAKQARLPWWFALAAAALFAVHPLHTEAVANIKGRDEIIALLGAVGGTWLIFRAAERQRFLGAAAGAMLVFLGCLAKENALTFLAVIPAVLLIFGDHKKGWGRLNYVLPALGAVILFLAIRSSVIGLSLGEPVMELMNNPFLEMKNGSWVHLSTGDRLATVMHTLWEYIRLLFVPTGLVHDYYPMAVPVKSWTEITPWLGLLLHAGMAVFALLKFRSHPFVALGILIYLASLSIVSNVFFSVGTNMSERFLFMPSLGWAIAVTALIARGVRKFGSAVAYAVPALALVFSVLTIVRNPVWKDNFTLFTTDVEKQPNSAKLLNAAGGVKVDRFQQLSATEKPGQISLLTEAADHLTRAIEIHPTYKNAYLLRGNAYLLQDNYDAAIADYDQALTLDGGYQAATDNLVIALTAAGKDAGEAKGDLAGAFRYLRRAEQLAPDNYETLRLLGVAYGVSGQTAAAISYFKRASEVNANDPDARWNYAIALYNAGQTDAAEVEFQAAERLKPGIRRERAGN
ncbi:tetratricopeptide repeat protein [Neolewinella aurantiaca]|uniref:Tetratricopeptide repeat protein n=1 Tax=Neolewinella aurantiaca TaxID=2602767 RepID=A0A5C7F9H4_9BACT|nr:tetratricopeptide repeat protein [Neolewinella aurantiaca]TXF86713.1 tetratricopeptide repeat protein [Neolewinella aurantiaca]